jgi:hypothetical protein
MVYNGGSWQNAGSSVNGTAARFKFVATASQTAFTGTDANGATLAYDSGYIDVYLNGVHLDPSDYTATDGSTITLASGAAAGDELYVVAFGTFTLATHYSSAQLDGGQLDNRYYTESEVDAALAGISSDALIDSGGTTRVQATTSGANVTGNLGVGTSSPSSILHLESAAAPKLTIKDTRTPTTVALQTQNGFGWLAVETNHSLGFATNNSERMRIDSSGNVGIGTSAPSHPLEVYKQGAAAYGSWERLIELNSPYPNYDENVTKVTLDAGVPDLSGNNQQNTGHGWFGVSTNGSDGLQRRLIIDAKGRVTMPYQPVVQLGRNTGYTTTGSVIPWNVVFTNIGNHYNTATGTFTAPVAGNYLVNIMVMSESSSSSMDIGIVVNGNANDNRLVPYTTGYGQHTQSSGSAILRLNANDTIYARLNSGSIYGGANGRHGAFGIALIS